MDELILRMLPREFRSRHGGELQEMLTRSARPVRDRTDVVMAALGLRLGRALHPLLVSAVLVGCMFAVGLVLAVGSLKDGVMEIPDHWWSLFVAAGFVCSSVSGIALRRAEHRAATWRHPG